MAKLQDWLENEVLELKEELAKGSEKVEVLMECFDCLMFGIQDESLIEHLAPYGFLLKEIWFDNQKFREQAFQVWVEKKRRKYGFNPDQTLENLQKVLTRV